MFSIWTKIGNLKTKLLDPVAIQDYPGSQVVREWSLIGEKYELPLKNGSTITVFKIHGKSKTDPTMQTLGNSIDQELKKEPGTGTNPRNVFLEDDWRKDNLKPAPEAKTNCHGLWLTDGKFVVDNPEVEKIIPFLKPTDKPNVGDVAIFRNQKGRIVHTEIVSKVENGEIFFWGKGGIEEITERFLEQREKDFDAKPIFYILPED